MKYGLLILVAGLLLAGCSKQQTSVASSLLSGMQAGAVTVAAADPNNKTAAKVAKALTEAETVAALAQVAEGVNFSDPNAAKAYGQIVTQILLTKGR